MFEVLLGAWAGRWVLRILLSLASAYSLVWLGKSLWAEAIQPLLGLDVPPSVDDALSVLPTVILGFLYLAAFVIIVFGGIGFFLGVLIEVALGRIRRYRQERRELEELKSELLSWEDLPDDYKARLAQIPSRRPVALPWNPFARRIRAMFVLQRRRLRSKIRRRLLTLSYPHRTVITPSSPSTRRPSCPCRKRHG